MGAANKVQEIRSQEKFINFQIQNGGWSKNLGRIYISE